ncbi:unnamed protein product [Prunus armeniaca]
MGLLGRPRQWKNLWQPLRPPRRWMKNCERLLMPLIKKKKLPRMKKRRRFLLK